MGEEVALAFVADVEQAVASVRELAGSAQELAGTAKEAADGVASITAPADEAAAAADRLTVANDEAAAAAERLTVASKEAGDAAGASAAKSDAAAGGGLGKYKMAAVGVGVGLALAVKGAADFQQSTTKLVTSAGESASQLGMVQQGILALSAQTATSSEQLSSGMYMIESAGFHGAAGLTVLKAAAQGAKAEGADLGEVANAVTSGLNAYGMGASQATAFTNQMVTAVGQGKMTMQDLASSLSNVLPIAASAHISFAQVGGAIATMTSQGMSAQQATQDLANMIRGIIHPNATAAAEMRALGLNANQVANSVGKQGLTGTMQEFTDAILRNTQGGNVLVGYMHEMTPAVQGVAREILAGTISVKELRTATQAMNPQQAKLISLFETSATSATGLKQTYAGAMAAMTGGATGLNVALMLGGTHAKTFAANVKAVGDAAKGAGGNVKGWGDITKETSFQLAKAKYSVEAAGTSLGMVLLPAVNAILGPLSSFLAVIAQNKAAAIAFAVVIGALLAGALGNKLADSIRDTKKTITDLGDGIESLIKKMLAMRGAQAAASAEATAASEAQTVAQEAQTAATEAQTAATEAGTVAQEGMDAAEAANPIGLIIIAVIALAIAIYELVKHWKTVWHFITSIVDDALKWLKQNWMLVVGIMLGPIALVAGLVFKYWRQIWHFITSAVDDVLGFLRAHWPLILAIMTGPIGLLVLFVVDHFHQIVHFLESLPAQFFQIGKDIIMGLIHGVEQQAGQLLSYLSSLASQVTGVFGSILGIHSPSRVFAEHGANIVRGLIQGIQAESPRLQGVMRGLGGSVGAFGGSVGGGGYGSGPLNVTVPVNLMPGTQGYNDPRLLQAIQVAVQEAILRYNVSNPSNGLAITAGGRGL